MTKSSDRLLLSFEKPVADLEQRIEEIRALAEDNELEASEQIQQLEHRAAELRKEIFLRLSPAQRLQVARHPRRPSTLDYIQTICDDWFELHGDRHGCDDPALVVGLARLAERPVVVMGHQKGRDTKDNVLRNFGMPNPGGYRKALRLIQHADRFSLPILTLIDTPGAYPGIEAEQTGQGEAIAVNLRELFQVEVPVICTVIGEGGSGGALAIGVGNRILMFEHSVYSVISPEGCAAILWKDASKAGRAAQALKITARDLEGLGVIDEILPEPIGGAHRAPLEAAETLKQAWIRHLNELSALSGRQLREQRYHKFRQMGVFVEPPLASGNR
ncbi:acetyl-CoA carboxylase carboxyltransferase subunit alpha [Synechococcus sp. PCC 7336]|uniref:acetyl-CoA carboxylase carboxyltransferase subunit alpha n=1 Tax=Synechococcus sp. PCC 7336 TaxID=195250 RepID=UPI000346C56A|nr:acetyl-CoA carboxylase carboxyltransferase subunit alpha [Synechococcus sp. PCC 7336]